LLVCTEAGEIQSVWPDGNPLGILPDATFKDIHLALDDYSCALFVTDGLTEARNPQGELFGEQRLAAWVKRSVKTGRTAAELCAAFQSELHSFQSQTPITDDQTFLILARESMAAGDDERSL